MDKLTQLRTFIRVAERASFSAVARDMGITQSAVSREISALEESLGARLVSRSTRRVADRSWPALLRTLRANSG